jgi:programmed cell death protein 5
MNREGFEDKEIEEIRQRKLEELRKKAELERQAQIAAAQRRATLRQILTPEALARLDNIKVVRPELAEALEQQLISLAASGRIKVPIDDATLKKILENVYNQIRREYRFKL